MTPTELAKLKQYVNYLQSKQDVANNFYNKSGHLKDLYAALAFEHARELIITLFPEVENIA